MAFLVSFSQVLSRRSAHWPVLAGAVTVAVFTTLAKVASAVKIAVTARYFGTGDEIDAFLTAFLIPAMFADTVAASFTQGLVPGLIRAKAQGGESAAQHVARSGLAFSLAAMLILMLGLAVASPLLVPVMGSSFSANKLRLTMQLLLGLLVWLPLGGMIASWRAVLHAHGRFALAAAAPLTTPLITIGFLAAGAAQQGVGMLVVATLIGVACEWSIVLAAVRRLGYPVSLIASGRKFALLREARELSREYLPLLSVATLASSSLLIDQVFAGGLGSGSVSILAYGTKMPGVVMMVSTFAVGTAVLPEFSRMAAGKEWRRLRRSVLLYSAVLTAASIPLTLALAWGSEPLARLFFERGAFHASDTRLVAEVQTYALIETPLAVLFGLMSRVSNAVSANSLLAAASVIAVIVNIAGDWMLSRVLGVGGIALASAIVRAVALAALAYLLYRREPRIFRTTH